MTTIKLPDNTKAALLLTVGDADEDGKYGIQATVYGDIPLDGTAEAREVIKLPEWEPVDPAEIPGALASLLKWAAPVIAGVLGFLGIKKA